MLFTGAGASRACGYPVTAEILPLILDRLKQRKFGDTHIDRHADALRAFLDHISPCGLYAAPADITEVLSIIDHCLESGQELTSVTRKHSLRLRDARWLLERAIARTVRKHYRRDVRTGEIVDWIEKQERSGAEVTVISTNYDYSLDRAWFNRRLKPWNQHYTKTDFGFTWRDPDDGQLVPPAAKPRVRLYKLHGSLNWLSCSRCGHVMVSFAFPIVINADGTGWFSKCWCDYQPLRAVLVAPSLVRSYRDPNLLSIWRSATEAMRLADEWVFVGYSLPKEDVAVRALLLRALLARERAPKTHIVSLGSDALPNYRRLLPRCRYTGDGLKAFLAGVASWQ